VQADGHPAKTKGGFEAELLAPEFEDDSLAVLQPGNLRAADDRDTRAQHVVSANDIHHAMQMVRNANEASLCYTDGAETDTTDFQPICRALVGQGAIAAACANNESSLDDPKVDNAGLCRRFVETPDSTTAASKRAAPNLIARMSLTIVASALC